MRLGLRTHLLLKPPRYEGIKSKLGQTMEKWVWGNVQKLEAEKTFKDIFTLALLSLAGHGDILNDAGFVQKLRELRSFTTLPEPYTRLFVM